MRLLNSGCDGRQNVFILNDTQIIYDYFLEDINNLLNTGEISNLYEKDDFERMAESLERPMKQLGRPISPESIYQTYIERLRNQFHVILCMSPVGDQLRLRCRNFPSLVNCCTLDWFDNWPQDALETVAQLFIADNALVKNEDKISISKLFPVIHGSVQEVCDQFFSEQKRRVYLTPKTFLDALDQFGEQLNHKMQEMKLQLTRLQNGIDKLDVTKQQISELKIKLTELVPQLQEENEYASKQADEIGLKKQAAQKQEIETEQEAQFVQKEAEEIKILKDLSDTELEKAKPALISAIKAVNELNKDDITELKKVNNPVPAVELALKCTLIYLGYAKQDWPVAQKALADMKFLDRLRNYEKDSIPEVLLAKIKNLTEKPEFNIEVMTRASKAAGGLAKWCYAIRIYAEAQIVVKPLLEKQLVMTEKFDQAQMEVQNKQEQLIKIKAEIQELEDKFERTQNIIETLHDEKTISERRLVNVSSLIELLADEKVRWQAEVEQIKRDIDKLVGNVFLSVNQMSYLGAFTGSYRQQLLQQWIALCLRHGIEISENYSIGKIMTNQMEIREWNIGGLPSDSVSIDNAIFTSKAHRWPLLIDPQFQALNWLKKMYQKNQAEDAKTFFALKLPKVQSKDGNNEEVLRINNILVSSLVNGGVVLFEDIDEFIDPNIEQIVSKAVFVQDEILQINFDNKNIEYNEDFKLFLTTKLANPHYMPEVFIKTTIINFTVTFEGLNEQFLADVVINLEPEVEQQRDALVIEISKIKNDNYFLQSSILNELAESNQETILDNTDLIQSLKSSKIKSKEIAESLERSELIEQTIEEKRNQYDAISVRGSIIYFVIASLSSIDPMYLNSLVYVKKLFNETQIKMLEKINEQEQVLKKMGQTLDKNNEDLCRLMMEQITDALYISICQGLFESHKIIYSFLICVSIQKNAGLITEDEYNLLVVGPGACDKSKQLNYANLSDLHDFITRQQWDLANCMQQTIPQHFENLTRSIMLQQEEWKNFIQDDGKQESAFAKVLYPFNEIPLFMQLLLFKLFKPQNLIKALKEYVGLELGHEYAQSPPSSLQLLFETADKITPIIFVLSQGADPNEQIMSFAKKKQFQDKFRQKSLGQGQEMAAQRLIEKGAERGEWILLQNCHLFKSWMPQLEIICNRIREDSHEVHDDFQLILTSLPVEFFPDSILQNGLKMTTEPPQGLKANLKRTFTNVIDRDLFYEADVFQKELAAERASLEAANAEEDEGRGRGAEMNMAGQLGHRPTLQPGFRRHFDLVDCWKSLLFGLSFFHSIIQERKKFGSLGWNIQYQFNDSDLDSSIKMLQNFIFEAECVPWDSMLYMTGHINYGGRVTDDIDRILLLSLLENCYGKQLLNPNVHEELQKKRKAANKPSKKGVTSSKSKPAAKDAPKKADTLYYQYDFSFFESGRYAIPLKHQKFSDIHKYIEQLPDVDSPEIFGMHQNAEISYWQQRTNQILTTIQSIPEIPVIVKKATSTNTQGERGDPNQEIECQDDEGQGGRQEQHQQISMAQKQDMMVMALSMELHDRRPLEIGAQPHAKEIFKLNRHGLLHCYSIVLLQEQERYNRLLAEIDSSLCSLNRAIQGLEIMSPTLDQMYASFLKNEVPTNWQAVSYAANQNLAVWFSDLTQRVLFIRTWMTKGHPQAYWLSGFYFPHGFLTGILQTYARKYQKAIDFLQFRFVILDAEVGRQHEAARGSAPGAHKATPIGREEKEESKEAPQLDAGKQKESAQGPNDGVYIYGLYLESARWDGEAGCLVEQVPGELSCAMPFVHFLPFEVRHEVDPLSGSNIRSNIAAGLAALLQKPGRSLSAGGLAGQNTKGPDQPEEPSSSETKGKPRVRPTATFVGEDDPDPTDPCKYLCPVYKTSARAGVLSTTGRSTNYVLSIALPMIPKDQAALVPQQPSIPADFPKATHWTLRGTAILLNPPARQ